MSSLRRPPGPVRQLSLQQPPRRQQIRRQRSAEEEKPLQIYANPIRTKLCTNAQTETERPRVRVAWGEHHGPETNNVEVIARQIPGKPRPPTAKSSKLTTRLIVNEKASILYSRQELAERLRLAWKQREENKSNIDIFLAQNAVEDRCDSRLSTCTTATAPSTPATKEDVSNTRTNVSPSYHSSSSSDAPRLGAPESEQARNLLSETLPSIMINNKPLEATGKADPIESSNVADVTNIIQNSKALFGSTVDAVDQNRPRIADETACANSANNGTLNSELVHSAEDLNETDEFNRSIVQPIEREQTSCEDSKLNGDGNSAAEELQNEESDGDEESRKSCMESPIHVNPRNDSTDWLPSLIDKQDGLMRMICADKEFNLSPSNAKIKRANFHNCSNKAFVAPVSEKSTREKSSKEGPGEKTKRTNSAPPQRRQLSASGRTQVSIVIDAPAISKPESPGPESKLLERKDTVPAATCNEAQVKNAISNRAIKSAPMKRRAKSGKRRVPGGGASRDGEEDQERPRRGSTRGKSALETKAPDVITMVSLVSSADSDSDIDQNSPRDDKLIHELRNKLPTTPIIKTSGSPAIATTRKPIKSVSFQQDSFDGERDEDFRDEKRISLYLQQRFPVVCRGNGSALPTPEEAATWRPEDAAFVFSTPVPSHEIEEVPEAPVTDREKRCLAVPIGDIRDKKRRLLRTRSTPPRSAGDEKQLVMAELGETRSRVEIASNEKNGSLSRQSPSLSENLVSKVEVDPSISATELDPDITSTSTEPQFQTTKEKECWHLYRRMCDKGVYVSFDTVLRGMLTPTEYRLRQRELTESS